MDTIIVLIFGLIGILISTVTLWGCIKLFERKASFFVLFATITLTLIIQSVGTTLFEGNSSLMILIYLISMAVFFSGIYFFSTIKNIFELFLIFLLTIAIETGLEKLFGKLLISIVT